MTLIGLTFLVAAGLATAAATQRPWFEKYVREKYAPTADNIDRVGRQLTDMAAGVEAVRALSSADRGALYEGWMQASDWPGLAAAIMVRADPEFYGARARRTLVCGAAEQKQRALEFLKISAHPAALGVLERCREQALSRRSHALANAAGLALDTCRQGLKREDAVDP
jgi:hypothetical protein